MMNEEKPGKATQSHPKATSKPPQSHVHASCMGGMRQVQARYMRGTCEVHARYMRGTCEVHAWCKLAQSQGSWRASLLVPWCFRRGLGSTTASPAGPGLILTPLVWTIFKGNRVFRLNLLPLAGWRAMIKPSRGPERLHGKCSSRRKEALINWRMAGCRRDLSLLTSAATRHGISQARSEDPSPLAIFMAVGRGL
jgi:hypothetical protein